MSIINTYGTPRDPCSVKSIVYIGVKTDIRNIKGSVMEPKKYPPIAGIVSTIDLIPSAVMDTLLLPITIPATNRNNEYCSKPDSGYPYYEKRDETYNKTPKSGRCAPADASLCSAPLG